MAQAYAAWKEACVLLMGKMLPLPFGFQAVD